MDSPLGATVIGRRQVEIEAGETGITYYVTVETYLAWPPRDGHTPEHRLVQSIEDRRWLCLDCGPAPGQFVRMNV